MSNDPIWIKGLFFNLPHENAPSFVKGSISIHPATFLKWVDDNSSLLNEKGYVKISLKVGKSGKEYAEVDTYIPKQKDDNQPPMP